MSFNTIGDKQMSEKENINEMEEDIEVLETHEDSEDDLLEFKASLGDPSEIPDPKVKKTTEKKKDKGEPMLKPKGAAGTKAGMMSELVQKMQSMTKEELSASYNRILEADDDSEEVIEDSKISTTKTPFKITAEDIDVSSDIDVMFEGDDLSEDFKEKAKTIFQAAVVSRINEEIEKLALENNADIEQTINEEIEAMTEKVDSYLDYVVSEWLEENKLAIEKGVRADMVEEFLTGLKSLFTEHYVDIPEEKVDVIEELMSKVESLEDKLNEQTSKNVELDGLVKSFEIDASFGKVAEDLSDTQAEKLRGLAEGISFTDTEDFEKKLYLIKGKYFTESAGPAESIIDDDSSDSAQSLEEEVEVKTGTMGNYVSAISRSAKK
jgi:hypothetical protein